MVHCQFREFDCSDATLVASVLERLIVEWSTLLAQVRYAVSNRESVVAMRRQSRLFWSDLAWQWSTLLAQVRYAVFNREFSCSDAPLVASVM
ncbi:hypothetical protein, partial [Lentimonas sp. CC10]